MIAGSRRAALRWNNVSGLPGKGPHPTECRNLIKTPLVLCRALSGDPRIIGIEIYLEIPNIGSLTQHQSYEAVELHIRTHLMVLLDLSLPSTQIVGPQEPKGSSILYRRSLRG